MLSSIKFSEVLLCFQCDDMSLSGIDFLTTDKGLLKKLLCLSYSE